MKTSCVTYIVKRHKAFQVFSELKAQNKHLSWDFLYSVIKTKAFG